jgi:hypothetical protein
MARGRIPLWLKIVYTAFVAVLVPWYWRAYTPWNFLNFCDIALLVLVPAIWLESSLLVSMEAVAILLVQVVWLIDLIVGDVGGKFLGMTNYMFDPNLPLFTRLLSLFHAWVPILVLYLLARLGYDRRAIYWQSAIGLVVMLLSYFAAPWPPAPAGMPNMSVNLNHVLGPDPHVVQTWMPPLAFLAVVCAGLVAVIYLPTHLLLRRVFRPSR